MIHASHILTPVDPEKPTPALAQAIFWACQHHAVLHAVQVRAPEGDALPDASARPVPSDAVRRVVETHLRRAAPTVTPPLRAVTVRAPSNEEGLLHYAAEHAINLIVASPPAGADLPPVLHDHTLAALVEGASCPVLIADAAAGAFVPYRRLLAPVDFSRHAQGGLGHAKSLAALYEASLDVLHVLERPRYVALNATDMLSLADARLPERKALRRMQALFDAAPGPAVDAHFHVAHGSPAQHIASFAATHDNDLLVLSSHGSTGQSQHSLGTTATKILRRLAIPLFLVKSFEAALIPPSSAEPPHARSNDPP